MELGKQWKVVAVQNDLGCYRKGAKDAWPALQKALAKEGKMCKAEITLEEDPSIFSQPPLFKSAKYIEHAQEFYNRVADAVELIMEGGDFPLVVTGSHFAGGGSLAGAKSFHNKKRMGVIWIDAHADINSPYTSFSGNMHGMPVTTGLAMIHTNHMLPQNKGEAKEVKKPWFDLCDTKGIMPKITPRDLVFIGIRDLDEKELLVLEENNIKFYNPEQMRKAGIKKMLHEVRDYLSECDVVYLSFDVDSMDPRSVSDATGTPVLGGIHLDEMDEILSGLLDGSLPVCAFEISEINPNLEKPGQNVMAEATASLIAKHIQTRI